ncbi:hypothetical protein GCM10009624_16270 [Gordonia sinesedis]
MNLPDLVDPLTEHRVSGDASGHEVFEATQTLLVLRNVVDHQLSVHVAALDRLGVASQHGRSLRELLIVMGCAPVVAQRLVRIAGSLNDLAVPAGMRRMGRCQPNTTTLWCGGWRTLIGEQWNRSTTRCVRSV